MGARLGDTNFLGANSEFMCDRLCPAGALSHSRAGGRYLRQEEHPSCLAWEHLCDLSGTAFRTVVLFPSPTLYRRDSSEASGRANELLNL